MPEGDDEQQEDGEPLLQQVRREVGERRRADDGRRERADEEPLDDAAVDEVAVHPDARPGLHHHGDGGDGDGLTDADGEREHRDHDDGGAEARHAADDGGEESHDGQRRDDGRVHGYPVASSSRPETIMKNSTA